jgi:alkanesulfonate monooxygenase SsuD/methylene tetrahydromethanopterin reductase-like flavin-dependent oxidoreductase (luciferase family)
MTSRPSCVTASGGPAGPDPVRADLFLLAGQFPGITPGQALRDTLTCALAAEQAGFRGVWIAEHHFLSYGSCPSALALAAYLLGRTAAPRVGTAACILPSRHPVALGEEAALLTEVSGGRLDLGVGRGGPWVDLEVFGTGLDRYETGFAESLDLLLAWLSGTGKVGTDGRHSARDALRKTMPGWLATAAGYTRIDGSPGPARDPGTYLHQLMSIHPVGDPDLCVRRLTDAIDSTGVRHILLMAEGAGDPAATVENISRLGTQVLPRLQS